MSETYHSSVGFGIKQAADLTNHRMALFYRASLRASTNVDFNLLRRHPL